MAQTTVSPEVLAALRQQAGTYQTARNSVSMFAKFPGPPGHYYARLIRANLGVNKKTGYPQYLYGLVTMGRIPEATTGQTAIDTSLAGTPIRIQNFTHATAKRSEAENAAAAMETLQGFGVVTSQLGNTANGTYSPNQFVVDILEVFRRLEDEKPGVVVEVSATGDKQYINVRSRLSDDLTAKFAKVEINITDEDLAINDDIAPLEDPESVLRDKIKGISDTDLINMLAAQGATKGWTVNFAEQTREFNTNFAIAAALEKPLPSPEQPVVQQLPEPTFAPGVVASIPDTAVASTTNGDTTVTGLEDDMLDDEVLDDTTEPDSELIRIQMEVAMLDRNGLKRAILGLKGRPAGYKWKASETDEDLRNELIGRRLGKIPPVEEAPFNTVSVPETVTI